MTRIISGIVLASAIVCLTLFGGELLFFIAVELVIIACLTEYFKGLEHGKEPALFITGVITGATIAPFLYFCMIEAQFEFLLFLPLLIFIFLLITVTAIIKSDDPFSASANTFFGISYIGLTLSALILLRNEDFGRLLVIMMITGTSFSDMFAFYTGKAFGKTKLAPKISPNKTVEGFLGGVVGALVGTAVIKALFIPSITYIDSTVAGLMAGLLGPMGDLAESAFKRKVGIKDSGSIIPGHGGALDRVDSIMFAASGYFFYLTISAAL